MDEVEVIERNIVFDGYLKVEAVRLRHRLFDGSIGKAVDRQIVRRRDAVVVLARDTQTDRYALVRQFRYACYANGEAGWLVEAVAGVIEEGESPTQAALREVREECGLEVSSLTPVALAYASPGTSTERYHLFIAEGPLGDACKSADDLEDIEVVWASRDELARMLREGEIRDAKTLLLVQSLFVEQPNAGGARP